MSPFHACIWIVRFWLLCRGTFAWEMLPVHACIVGQFRLFSKFGTENWERCLCYKCFNVYFCPIFAGYGLGYTSFKKWFDACVFIHTQLHILYMLYQESSRSHHVLYLFRCLRQWNHWEADLWNIFCSLSSVSRLALLDVARIMFAVDMATLGAKFTKY